MSKANKHVELAVLPPSLQTHLDTKADDQEEAEWERSLRRVSHVLLPLLFLNGALGHFEKGNLAFAALQLNKQLHFSPVSYGVGSGLFFLAYGAAILPSTFMTVRYGARRWLGLTTFACGVVGMMHALMANRRGFYVLRCLMGIAEAGGGSSTGHLLAQFYPKSRLAQPFTVVMLSYFAAGVMAAPLATGLMAMDGLGGLRGWQWLFILESIPSLLMAAVIWVWLPSRPLTAWMLTPQQRELVHRKVYESDEAAEAARVPPQWSQLLSIIWDATKRPLLWFFTAVSLLHGLCMFSFQPWLTLIINSALGSSSASAGAPQHHHSPGAVPVKAILLSAVPSVTGSIAAVVCAWSSDRTRERHLHVALPWILSGTLLALFGPMLSLSFAAGYVALVLAKTLSAASSGVVSSLLVGCLDIHTAGMGLALQHAVVACGGGFAGPVFVGALVQRTGSFDKAMVLNGCLQIGAALLMVGLAGWTRGWCCRKHNGITPPQLTPQTAPGGALAAAAAAAAAVADEDAPGSLPELMMCSPREAVVQRKSGDAV